MYSLERSVAHVRVRANPKHASECQLEPPFGHTDVATQRKVRHHPLVATLEEHNNLVHQVGVLKATNPSADGDLHHVTAHRSNSCVEQPIITKAVSDRRCVTVRSNLGQQ